MGSVGWAVVAVLLALAMGAFVLLRVKAAPEYGAAIIWALVGVVVANAAGGSTLILALAAFGVVVMALVTWKAAQRAV